MKRREYAKKISLAVVSALLMGAVQPQAVLARENIEGMEAIDRPVVKQEDPFKVLSVSFKVTEGEETKQKVVEIKKENVTIKSKGVYDLTIDEQGYLVGTPKVEEWQKGAEITSGRIDVTIKDEETKKEKSYQIRIYVKRGPVEISVESIETLTEGSPISNKKIISVNREQFELKSEIVHGLRIDFPGILVGTPRGFHWTEGQNEQEVKLKVTVTIDGSTKKAEKDIAIKVKKKEESKKDEQSKKEEESKKDEQSKKEEESKKDEQSKKEEESKKDEQSKKEEEPKKDEQPKKEEQSKPDKKQEAPNNSIGSGGSSGGGGGAGGSSSSKPAVAEPKKEEAVPPVTLPATQEKEVGKVERSSYITGYSDKTVRPNASITRAEVATMIAKLKNYTLDEAADSKFADVKDQWFSKYVNAVVREGLTKGYADGSFQPNREITRAEFVQMIMAISSPNTTEKTFNDVKGHWAEAAIKQAYANGIVSGYKDGSFKPDQKISRAEAVVILNKLFHRTTMIGEVQNVEFKDLKSDHWAYQDILAALGK